MKEPPLTPEALVPRIGDYLLEKGLITASDLQHALFEQEEQLREGKHLQIGSILLELGFVDRATLDQAIAEQVIKLRAALQDANRQLEQRVKDRTVELQVALKKLSELNKLKSNIIANVSHELRTPLTYTIGYLDLLTSGAFGELTTDQAKTLDIIKHSTDRLNGLINDLIRFSAAAQGEMQINMVPLKPIVIASNAMKTVRRKAEDKSISLEVLIPQNLPAAVGDQEGITWVMTQLLDNAVKFTPQEGRVILSSKLDGNFIEFAVTDTGIGIPQNRILDVFEPFQQLDGSSTRHYGGTGLGLALVKQIIEAHGSVVRVYSQVGKGSKFEFFLPVEKKANNA
jgi:signal transduction histidine kinase